MSWPVCARRLADEDFKPKLLEVFDAKYRICRRQNVKAVLRRRHGINLDHGRIARLLRELGIRGAAYQNDGLDPFGSVLAASTRCR